MTLHRTIVTAKSELLLSESERRYPAADSITWSTIRMSRITRWTLDLGKVEGVRKSLP